MATQDYFNAKDTFDTGSGPAVIYRLSALEEQGVAEYRAPALFDPGAAGGRAASGRRL